MSQGPSMEDMEPTNKDGTDVKIADTVEVLEIIREEQVTPIESNANVETKTSEDECNNEVICNCNCRKVEEETDRISPEQLETILKEKEAMLREEYDKRLEKEMVFVKDRFDFILSNEQMRASYMLREAHRERQEKITALQTQLECKNLAGLMYVMCSERRRSKLERLRLVEEYTNYIRVLQDILTEGQTLILHLSRGYKTAARIDHEWREKMKKVVQEFMSFIYNYSGGTPESNQYFFDLPRLLKADAPTEDNPEEDPCDTEEGDGESLNAEEREKTWWDGLDGDCRPFVMFGDMADFKPDRRREVLKTVKAAKTAPRKWKEYAFNNMFIQAECPNSDSIKDVYPERLSTQKWECSEALPDSPGSKMPRESIAPQYRRATAQSIDIRGDMGSLLKIITSANTSHQTPKTTLLGARDSMEIQSTTKLVKKMRDKSKKKKESKAKVEEKDCLASKIVLNIGKRRASMFGDVEEEGVEEEEDDDDEPSHDEDDVDETSSPLGVHTDSLEVVQTNVADTRDRIINYEKECPLEKCHRMQVDSFIRSLPPYMRSNPYTHFEQTFEEYETCTPEQLQILKQRMDAKKAKEAPEEPEPSPLAEWTPSVHGVTTQTSELSVHLPPCTCNLPSPDPSMGMVFNVNDLIPVKQALECISKACFFDEHIQFNRFKVIGQESSDNVNNGTKIDFKQRRYHEIKRILKQHPSLLDIFQANTRC